MGTAVAVLQAHCPLCGSPVLSVSRGGRVTSEDLHPIQIGRGPARGYTLCDDCSILANLPADLTRN
jgi:hypothetical protein